MAPSRFKAYLSERDLKKYTEPVKSIRKTVTLNIESYSKFAGMCSTITNRRGKLYASIDFGIEKSSVPMYDL